MAYHPIIISLSGSPVIDPYTNGFFTVAGNQIAVFTPGTPFIVYDNNSPVSNVYAFTTLSSSFDGSNTEVVPTAAPGDISPYTYQQAVDGGYTIYYSDGSKTPISIDVATIDSTTSLNLPGRGVLSYGEAIDGDLLHLLENFAGPTSPSNPIEGQLWYDTSGSPPANLIKVWNASSVAWESFAGTGKDSEFILGSAAFAVNLTTDGITPVDVNVQPKSGTISYQQVFVNGVLQREDDSSFTNNGNYYVTGIGGNIVFAYDLAALDEVLIYAL